VSLGRLLRPEDSGDPIAKSFTHESLCLVANEERSQFGLGVCFLEAFLPDAVEASPGAVAT
jgi:hypothetical protein